jgi:hypothetical protein
MDYRGTESSVDTGQVRSLQASALFVQVRLRNQLRSSKVCCSFIDALHPESGLSRARGGLP